VRIRSAVYFLGSEVTVTSTWAPFLELHVIAMFVRHTIFNAEIAIAAVGPVHGIWAISGWLRRGLEKRN
jgi:hypothetical protein